jgi:hypothetical protein
MVAPSPHATHRANHPSVAACRFPQPSAYRRAVPPSRIPQVKSQHLPPRRKTFALCFHTHADRFPRNSPVLTFICVARGWGCRAAQFTAAGRNLTCATGVGCTCSPRNKMNTYAKCAANPRGVLTSEIIGLKVSCNEHFQKNGGRGGLLLPSGGRGLYLEPAQIWLVVLAGQIALALQAQGAAMHGLRDVLAVRKRLEVLRVNQRKQMKRDVDGGLGVKD